MAIKYENTIELKEVSQNDIRSCNVCIARNYHTELTSIGKYVDKLYSLDIGQMSICLCGDCLCNLSATIESFSSKYMKGE